ncbi:hypothetical protein [Thalassospira profundimaris]|nr:hypothetical protein [Thalassospira profundimaris]
MNQSKQKDAADLHSGNDRKTDRQQNLKLADNEDAYPVLIVFYR